MPNQATVTITVGERTWKDVPVPDIQEFKTGLQGRPDLVYWHKLALEDVLVCLQPEKLTDPEDVDWHKAGLKSWLPITAACACMWFEDEAAKYGATSFDCNGCPVFSDLDTRNKHYESMVSAATWREIWRACR